MSTESLQFTTRVSLNYRLGPSFKSKQTEVSGRSGLCCMGFVPLCVCVCVLRKKVTLMNMLT